MDRTERGRGIIESAAKSSPLTVWGINRFCVCIPYCKFVHSLWEVRSVAEMFHLVETSSVPNCRLFHRLGYAMCKWRIAFAPGRT